MEYRINLQKLEVPEISPPILVKRKEEKKEEERKRKERDEEEKDVRDEEKRIRVEGNCQVGGSAGSGDVSDRKRIAEDISERR